MHQFHRYGLQFKILTPSHSGVILTQENNLHTEWVINSGDIEGPNHNSYRSFPRTDLYKLGLELDTLVETYAILKAWLQIQYYLIHSSLSS